MAGVVMLGSMSRSATAQESSNSNQRKDSTDVKVEKLPATADEFVAMRDQLATTPEGGAAMFVVALLKFAEDQNVGTDFLTISIDGKWLMDDKNGYKGKSVLRLYMQNLRERIAEKPYVARSYVQGTSPENEYVLPDYPITIKVFEQTGDADTNKANGEKGGMVKYFVYSTGADSPRPIQLKKNNRGLWKAYDWGSLLVGVRPPVKKTDDVL
jgi:hypothetical protein